MANLKAVKKWANRESRSVQYRWSRQEISDQIYLGLKQYDSPVEPEPEPKPIKLEAGCRVNVREASGGGVRCAATVIHVCESGDRVIIKIGPTEFEVIHKSQLIVTKAATPEVGDYVRRDCGDVGILDYVPDSGTTGWYGFQEGDHVTPVRRDEFTILRKAPKGGE